MGEGVGEVLPFAVGIAIVPVPIIAVILMLFSQRAKVNGPLFVIGWVVGLAASLSVLAPVAYFFTGGEKAKQSLDELEAWLGANNAAVMTVLLLVFGVVLISKGLGPLTA